MNSYSKANVSYVTLRKVEQKAPVESEWLAGWLSAHPALLLDVKDTSPPPALLLLHSLDGQPPSAIQNDDETSLLGHSWGKMNRTIIIIICISP